jgi:hypothetical protein
VLFKNFLDVYLSIFYLARAGGGKSISKDAEDWLPKKRLF